MFRFRFKDRQTVFYSRIFPNLKLPSVHTTWHAKTEGHDASVVHVKAVNQKPYLRQALNINSSTVFQYPFLMVDLTQVNWANVKKYKSKKTEDVVVIPHPFPEYITAYFFQGNNILLPRIMEQFTNSKDALAFFPFYDGVYTGPKGHPLKGMTFTYELDQNVSCGGLILGAVPPQKGYDPRYVKPINKGELVAFAPSKEKVIKC